MCVCVCVCEYVCTHMHTQYIVNTISYLYKYIEKRTI